MDRSRYLVCLFGFVLTLASPAAPCRMPDLPLKTASTHPMQYYVSLPQGWSAQKKWPVLVLIESANRQFLETLGIFEKARGRAPFILVAPLVVTNGGAHYREVPSYHYTEEVWKQAEQAPFKFDYEGLVAVLKDVRGQFGGEEKYFLTGWEAGGHTVWAIALQHPETLRAVAPVCPNYAGRWLDEAHLSTSPTRADLPIRGLCGARDTFYDPGRPGDVQWRRAETVARAHGFKNITLTRIEGKDHEPLAKEVIGVFSSMLAR